MQSTRNWVPIAVGGCVVIVILAVTGKRMLQDNSSPSDGSSIQADAATDAAEGDGHLPLAVRRARRNAAPSAAPMGAPGQVKAIVAQRTRNVKALSARNEAIKAAAVSRYANEKQDVAWAAGKERALAGVAQDVAAASSAKPRDLVSQCKQTVCRTTATFASAGEADEWVSLYMASMGDVMKHSVVSTNRNQQGAIGVEIYSSVD